MTDLAKYIDHTNLKSISRKEFDKLVREAKQYHFEGLCIEPGWVALAKQKLQGTGTKVVTVPNWAKGGGLARLSGVTELACRAADEVDYIWDIANFANLKSYEKSALEIEEIRKVTPGVLKIIIECSYLRMVCVRDKLNYEDMLKQACEIVNSSKADWIKTDSGLFPRISVKEMSPGVTMEVPPIEMLYDDVTIMKKYSTKPIKASAGIKSRFEVEELLKIGAQRIGTSAGVAIVLEKEPNGPTSVS